MVHSFSSREIRGARGAFRRLRQTRRGPRNRPQDNMQRAQQHQEHPQRGPSGSEQAAPHQLSHEEPGPLPGLPDRQRGPLRFRTGVVRRPVRSIGAGHTFRERGTVYGTVPGQRGLRGGTVRAGQRVPHGCVGMRPRWRSRRKRGRRRGTVDHIPRKQDVEGDRHRRAGALLRHRQHRNQGAHRSAGGEGQQVHQEERFRGGHHKRDGRRHHRGIRRPQEGGLREARPPHDAGPQAAVHTRGLMQGAQHPRERLPPLLLRREAHRFRRRGMHGGAHGQTREGRKRHRVQGRDPVHHEERVGRGPHRIGDREGQPHGYTDGEASAIWAR